MKNWPRGGPNADFVLFIVRWMSVSRRSMRVDGKFVRAEGRGYKMKQRSTADFGDRAALAC